MSDFIKLVLLIMGLFFLFLTSVAVWLIFHHTFMEETRYVYHSSTQTCWGEIPIHEVMMTATVVECPFKPH